MYAYIKGTLIHKNPAYIILEAGGLGYEINISLNTYGQLPEEGSKECVLQTHFHVKEDAQTLFGFAENEEKQLFVQLISISGVGPNTARMVLSTFAPEDFRRAVVMEDVATVQSVKGIGPKSAKRIILELKDKLQKQPVQENISISAGGGNTINQEALSALIMLGFSRQDADKAVQKARKNNPGIDHLEVLIKEALKNI